jgi:hypothetical protein
MRGLVIKLVLFIALLEVLDRVSFLTLLLALGLGIAAIICTDLLVKSLSSRAQ